MDLSPGTQVSVSLEGMTVGGVPCGVGKSTSGAIVSIDGETLTIELNEPFGGETTVEVGPGRVKPRYD